MAGNSFKTENDLAALREGGHRLAFVMGEVAKAVKPGVKTSDLDALAEKLIREGGDKPSFLNYQPGGARMPFPASLCVSVNDEVVHGIPDGRVLKEGDIVGLDLGLEHKGLFTDMAVTVAAGQADEKAKELIQATRAALFEGIRAVKAGGYVGDIGNAIEKFVRPLGFGIVRELGGHGVGREVHEPPYIANFGERGTGEKLAAGTVLAIEPMITEGGSGVKLAPNGFTYVTRDGSRSAHFEHTVLVTENGAEIITK
jgi:methionyl aminopeptidase